MTKTFSKILIANRGEIACRVIATARRMGIRSVAVYSDADEHALHVDRADEAFRIGPAEAAESYLCVQAIIDAARRSGADAIHPGYGFLAENPEFAEACGQAGLSFIGPPAEAIRTMGSKDTALELAAAAGVPVLPGYHGSDQSDKALREAADVIGYPLLIKPVAGGGGKGMRVVESARELRSAAQASRREARSAFADDRLLLEKYLLRPRHVEVQVFADDHGNAVHLFERDCSIQRRHQKIVEEAPAPGLDAELRRRMGTLAIELARAIDYRGAGTVEFLLDTGSRGTFFFMEMNTRLQVEHPVTEMILGVDLVEWQIDVARGKPLPATQSDLRISGHAMEARIYAEDPDHDFLPAVGRLERFDTPTTGEWLRLDTGVREGDHVGVHYDPMIAKLIVAGSDRDDCARRLRLALDECRIAGLPTNLALLKRIAAHTAFENARIDTAFIDDLTREPMAPLDAPDESLLAVACLFVVLERAVASTRHGRATRDPSSPWHGLPGWRLNGPAEDILIFHWNDREIRIPVHVEDGSSELTLPSGSVRVSGELLEHGDLHAIIAGHKVWASVARYAANLEVFLGGKHLRLRSEDHDRPSARAQALSGQLAAPMPGRVISVLVAQGEPVERGQPVMVIEAMKMEHTIRAPADGVVAQVSFVEGELVEEGAELLAIDQAGKPSSTSTKASE